MMQDIHLITTTNNNISVGGRLFGDRRLRTQGHEHHPNQQALKCPRCESSNTKFCYYNNYNLSQPRHFCKNCRRYWTKGGVLRNVPVGGGCRKSKKCSKRASSAAVASPPEQQQKATQQQSLSSSESSSNNKTMFQLPEPETENFGIGGEFMNTTINSNTSNNDNSTLFWSGVNGHVEGGDRMLDLTVTIDDLLLQNRGCWENPTVENGDQGLFDFTSTGDHNQDYWTQQRSTFEVHANWTHTNVNDPPLFLP